MQNLPNSDLSMAAGSAVPPPPPPPNVDTLGAQPTSHRLFTRIRRATESDAPHIHRLIHQMAVFEGLVHTFSATVESLSSTLFRPPPFPPTTVLLLVASRAPFPHAPPHKTLTLNAPIYDPEEAEFKAEGEDVDAVVAGFVMFYPHYSAFSAKAGLTVEELLVRECYRRKGMGEMLVAAVAAEAVRLGFGKVEWTVLDWNVDAIKFYERMGARILHKVKLCRLTGEPLCSLAAGPDSSVDESSL